MSFSEISDFRTELGRLAKAYPKLLRAGEITLLWTIISYPEGCFIGQQELANQAHLALSTKDTYLRKLTKLGFITREQTYARKGLRQCYRVSVKGMKNYCLPPVIAKTNSLLPITDKPMPITDEPNAYRRSYAYREYKDYKYDIDKERFDKFISLLPKDVGQYIEPGANLDNELDKLMAKGWTLETVCEHLSRKKYHHAYKVGGVVITHLQELSGNKTNYFEGIEWCKECPKSTRTYDERSPGVDGKDTYECPTCHPNQVRAKNQISKNLTTETLFNKVMGVDVANLLKGIDQA